MINTHASENKESEKTIAEQKLGNYYYGSTNNFAVEGEIVVTITLAEYRKLVSEYATKEADIKKAEADKYERTNRISELEKENATLKEKIYQYREQLETIGCVSKGENVNVN